MADLSERRMRMRDQTFGMSVLNIILGIWLIIAPFVLNYTNYPVAQGNDIVMGALVVLVALIRSFAGTMQPGWSWLSVIFGVWLIIAPFVLGYSGFATAQWNDIILGVLVALLAWSSARVRRTA